MCVCKGGGIDLSELPVTNFNLHKLPHSNGNVFTQIKENTLSELNVCHSTFGICFQKDLDVGCGDVSLLVLVPAHSCPAVSFVFFYDVQQLSLCHGDSALIMTCERTGRQMETKRKIKA